jgi:O-antigen ligase/polysaccharide polymerase Wzy-like membrane protein/tetratricopeptide repeat protein
MANLVTPLPGPAWREPLAATVTPAMRAVGFLMPAAIGVTAASHGGYFPTDWGWAALFFFWVAVLALLLRKEVQLGLLERGLLLALGALAGWTALSTLWSADPSQTVLEVERALVYVAGALAFVLIARRRLLTDLVGGLLCALSLVSLYALATRLFPEQLGTYDAIAVYRLNDPLGYWNALGIVTAMGALLALGLAARAHTVAGRALAAASLVVLVPTMYFTFGRGPWIALGFGLLAVIALDPRRLQFVTALFVLVPAPALAVWLGSRSEALTRQGTALEQASRDGQRLAIAIVALAALSALLAVLLQVLERKLEIPRGVRLAYGGLLALLAIVLVTSVVATYGGPKELATTVYDSFRGPPVGTSPGSDLTQRLFSLSGNGRFDLWEAAWTNYESHRWVGSGAGSYEQYWLENRSFPGKVRDAHGLYAETLSELGPIGLGLLLVAFALPVVAVFRARRHALIPAVFGAYVAYIVHAGADWDWEMPAVTLVGLYCGALILVAARRRRERPISTTVRGALIAVVVPMMAFAFIGLIGNSAIAESARAVNAGDAARAEDEARKAIRWAPWSAEAWQRLADAHYARGDLANARIALRRAIEKDRRDWTLWYDLGSVSTGRDQRRAYTEAAQLNPLSAQVAWLRFAGLLPKEQP